MGRTLFLEVPSPTSKMAQLLVPLASPVKFNTHACHGIFIYGDKKKVTIQFSLAISILQLEIYK